MVFECRVDRIVREVGEKCVAGGPGALAAHNDLCYDCLDKLPERVRLTKEVANSWIRS